MYRLPLLLAMLLLGAACSDAAAPPADEAPTSTFHDHLNHTHGEDLGPRGGFIAYEDMPKIDVEPIAVATGEGGTSLYFDTPLGVLAGLQRAAFIDGGIELTIDELRDDAWVFEGTRDGLKLSGSVGNCTVLVEDADGVLRSPCELSEDILQGRVLRSQMMIIENSG